jgi:hypothetical protein
MTTSDYNIDLTLDQGCQMVYLHTKNSNLRKFWKALKWKTLDHLVYFTVFGIFYRHLVYFPHFGMLYHENSGNPALDHTNG